MLALTVAIGGGLSAILATDMLVIAIVPLLIAERADRMEAGHTLAEYARAGAPIAVLPLGFAVFWLALTRTLPLLPQR